MKRTLFKFLSVNILLGIMCSTAYAVPKNQKNVDTSTNIKKEIQQEMNSYYQKYKSQLIDFNNFDNLSKTKQEKFKKSFGTYTTIDDKNLNRSKATGFRISWNRFKDGSMILVRRGYCAWGYWRHIGTYSASKGMCITAQLTDNGYGSGVIYEPKSWYTRHYDKGVGIDITPYNKNNRELSRMMKFLDYFKGREYGFPKHGKDLAHRDTWYCSLLPWKGYRVTFGADIDSDGGNYVLPDDIINYKPSTIIASSY